MAKNIVLLSDGTGNSAAKLQKTNVWRLYQSLDMTSGAQIAYYDDGVGTSAFRPLALLGGALGVGLKRNVLDLYEFLCRHYEEGDRIYCFGFSRGAFTIRVLSGLIRHQGLIRKDGARQMHRAARAAYRRYRDARYHTAIGIEKPLRALRDVVLAMLGRPTRIQQGRAVEIAFMGLWDTVSAYGLPVDELTKAWSWVFPLSVPDREPSPIVLRACHALALDDERHTFHPVLWNEAKLLCGNNQFRSIDDERITQVWFSGMHTNVGGGYPDDALSHVSLYWMMMQARAHGLRLQSHELLAVCEEKNPLGKMYDSRRGLAGFYRYRPRRLDVLGNDRADSANQVIVTRPKVHISVAQRIDSGIDQYAPIGLPREFAVVDDDGNILEQSEFARRFPTLGRALRSPSWDKDLARVWHRVWWRRVVYFATVAAALALVLFPLFRRATAACEGPFCALASIVRGMGALLPDFLAPWFKAYESHPGSFSVIVALLASLLWLGARLQIGIVDRMRLLWQDRCLPEPGPLGLASHAIARTGQGLALSRASRSLRRILLPFIAGLATIYLLLAALNAGLFAMLNSQGWVCPSGPAARPVETAVTLEPWPNDALCWASGAWLQGGRGYVLSLQVLDGWHDGPLEGVPITGLTPQRTPWFMLLGTPFRRHYSQPFFMPHARIGQQGSDEYPLRPASWSKPSPTVLQAEIHARSSGPLFLHVNDVALALPAAWQWFYRNNRGTARMTIEPLRAPMDLDRAQ